MRSMAWNPQCVQGDQTAKRQGEPEVADALSGGHRPPWLDAERCLPLCLRYADQVESLADDDSDMDTMVAVGTQQKTKDEHLEATQSGKHAVRCRGMAWGFKKRQRNIGRPHWQESFPCRSREGALTTMETAKWRLRMDKPLALQSWTATSKRQQSNGTRPEEKRSQGGTLERIK